MGNIIYFDEIKIKKELKRAEGAMEAARSLRATGIEVPNDIFGRLQQIINNLEKQLDDLVLDDE